MPSFVLLPYLFRRRPLCCTHIANAGGLLSSGIPGGRPSHTGRIRRDLGEFFGARVVGRQSPGQIDRVVSAPPCANRISVCGIARFLRLHCDHHLSNILVPQDPLAASEPKGTEGWDRALLLRRRRGSAHFVAPTRGVLSENCRSSRYRRRGDINISHAMPHATRICAYL